MEEKIKIIVIPEKGNLSFSMNYRPAISEKIEKIIENSFEAIMKTNQIDNVFSNQDVNLIKDYHLLESFIFANFVKPKFEKGSFVYVENNFIERIPNKVILAEISDVIIDSSKCEILYFLRYYLDNEYCFRVIKENLIIDIQNKDNATCHNYNGRDDLERFQYLKMKQRFECLAGN